MPAPNPIWWDPSLDGGNGLPTSTWNCQTVDADSWSVEKEFWIFNNKGGVSQVSDMTNVFITTKDSGGNDGPPVADQSKAIVYVKVWNGTVWEDAVAIGGSSNTADILNAAGYINSGLGDLKANRLSGMVNPTDPSDTNYSDTNTKKKMAKVKLQLHVLANADAGPMTWKTRVSYQYT